MRQIHRFTITARASLADANDDVTRLVQLHGPVEGVHGDWSPESLTDEQRAALTLHAQIQGRISHARFLLDEIARLNFGGPSAGPDGGGEPRDVDDELILESYAMVGKIARRAERRAVREATAARLGRLLTGLARALKRTTDAEARAELRGLQSAAVEIAELLEEGAELQPEPAVEEERRAAKGSRRRKTDSSTANVVDLATARATKAGAT